MTARGEIADTERGLEDYLGLNMCVQCLCVSFLSRSARVCHRLRAGQRYTVSSTGCVCVGDARVCRMATGLCEDDICTLTRYQHSDDKTLRREGCPPLPHHLVCVEKFTLPYLTPTLQYTAGGSHRLGRL